MSLFMGERELDQNMTSDSRNERLFAGIKEGESIFPSLSFGSGYLPIGEEDSFCLVELSPLPIGSDPEPSMFSFCLVSVSSIPRLFKPILCFEIP
jgi:hypothetical protein